MLYIPHITTWNLLLHHDFYREIFLLNFTYNIKLFYSMPGTLFNYNTMTPKLLTSILYLKESAQVISLLNTQCYINLLMIIGGMFAARLGVPILITWPYKFPLHKDKYYLQNTHVHRILCYSILVFYAIFREKYQLVII